MRLLNNVMNTTAPLLIAESPPGQEPSPGVLFYNAVVIELRDMFRMIAGLRVRGKNGTLKLHHVHAFYGWFDKFFEIIMTLFSAEDDFLFAYLQSIGSFMAVYSCSSKRRETKKERVKELCFDILELKLRFDQRAERNESLLEVTVELDEEGQQLAMRLTQYSCCVKEEMLRGVRKVCSEDECGTLFSGLMESLRKSDAGRFAIFAMSRGFVDKEQKKSLLRNTKEGWFKGGAAEWGMRKYKRMHQEVVEDLAVSPLHVEVEGCTHKET